MQKIATITNPQALTYWGSIQPDVVLTDERIGHIRKGHLEDYELFSRFIPQAITDPDVILEDDRNQRTGMFIRHIDDANINVLVKLACQGNESGLDSSVITMYRLGEKTLKRLMKNYCVVYKRP